MSASRRPRRCQTYDSASGTSTAGKSLAATASPRIPKPSRWRSQSSAASAARTSAIGQRSKRVKTTEPSRSGKTAIAARTATTLVRVAPSAARIRPAQTIASAPQSAIVPSKARRNAGWSPLSLRSAGSTNIGSAAGGYSSRKSRYGIEPPLDRVPVRLVHRQIDDLRVVVPATVQSGERRHEEESRRERGEASEPARRDHERSGRRRRRRGRNQGM